MSAVGIDGSKDKKMSAVMFIGEGTEYAIVNIAV